MSKTKCKGCDETFDIKDMAFIDNGEMPIVLDLQLTSPMSERKAINFVKRHHHIDPFDYEEDDGKLHMYHYDKAGNMSHEEPGYDEHTLDIPETGYWSFQ